MTQQQREAELAKPKPSLPKWEYEPTPEQDAELSEKYGDTKQ